MTTNIPKSSIVLGNIPKGKENVTWDEATFTWNQGNNSTWDAVGAIVIGNVQKSTVVKNVVTKSTI